MKRIAILTLLAGLLAATQCQAHGLFRRHGGCGDCAAPCAAPCEAAPVKYEERTVVRYKSVMVEREIEVLECKRVMMEEKYTYTVCTPVMKQVKRMEMVCTPVYKDVPYTYTVMVPKCVEKEVMCTTYRCVTEMVKECVPVCRTVCVTCVDECGRCHTHRERVTVMEERTRCVVKRIPETVKKMVTVTVCEPKTMTGMKRVCEIQRSEREVMCNVCEIVRTVKEGVRPVCHYETVKVKRKVQVCEMQKYEERVKVAVCTPCATTSCCQPACDSGCGHGHRGLFRRGGCCH